MLRVTDELPLRQADSGARLLNPFPFHSLQETFQARSGDCRSLGRARCDLGDPMLCKFQVVVFEVVPVVLQHLLAESAPKQEPPKANPRSRQEICNVVV